jgi:Xaa-Pro aminopeptidase
MGTHPHFTPDEFAGRLARLRSRIQALEVDIALFDELESMAWLTGYANSENRWRCVVIPMGGNPFYYIRALDAGPCRSHIWFNDVVTFRDWEDPMLGLAHALHARGLATARVGINLGSYCMPVARFEAMKTALPRAHFVDLGALVDELRLIKSPAEIGLMRKAASIADEALQRAAAECVRGGSQRAAAKAAISVFIDGGADPDRPGPITRARGWDFLHSHLDDEPLADGDVVHLEIVPRVGGYSARVMRCVAVGSPPLELTRAAERLVAIQDEQIAAIKPGIVAEEVDAIARDALTSSGLRESVDNITGYTLGYYSHATPHTSDFTRIFCPGARWRIEENMVFHMYASAKGVSFSETVLVTPGGAERLTRLPRTLIVNR